MNHDNNTDNQESGSAWKAWICKQQNTLKWLVHETMKLPYTQRGHLGCSTLLWKRARVSTNNGGIQIVHQRVHCGPDVRFFRSVNKLYPHTQREYFENTQHLASGMWWLEASREPANTRNVYTYIHTHTYIYMVSPSPETHVFDFTPTHHQIIVNQNWFNITSLIVATPH